MHIDIPYSGGRLRAHGQSAGSTFRMAMAYDDILRRAGLSQSVHTSSGLQREAVVATVECGILYQGIARGVYVYTIGACYTVACDCDTTYDDVLTIYRHDVPEYRALERHTLNEDIAAVYRTEEDRQA